MVDYVLSVKMHVLEGGETASAEDAADGRNILDARVAYLRETENVYWDDDAIPDSVKDCLADYLTHYFQSAFDPDATDAYARRSAMGLREMQSLLAIMDDGGPIQATYF
ncbi:MAG: hypothetical protein AAGF20_00990 [Pseudomonadota bacterium]